METIDSVGRAVAAWRSDHRGRRGPLPLELRREVGVLAGELGEEEVVSALDLKRPSVRAWRERYGRRGRARRSGVAPGFVEIEPELTRIAAQGALLVEVTGANGRVVRIQGTLDAHAIAAILSGALAPEVA